MKGGLVDKVQVATNASIGHSRTDLNGTIHDDYVSAVVKDAEGRERQYLISQLDSLVMPNGRRVVFVGNQNGYVNVNGNENQNENENQNKNENGSRSLKRSSFSGKFPGAGTGNVTFKWTENDRIRLDVGYESRAEQLSADGTSASFVFDEADDFESDSYLVYFPDRRVTIKSVQTQTGANNSLHIYDSGDCGTAIATRNENDNENSEHPSPNTHHPTSPTTYTFTLEHKAAYLCFLPHIDNLPSAKLTKITLSCSAAIAGTYELSGNGLYNGTATSSTITLNLVPQKNIDFFIGHDALTEQDSCAAYMVIAPQGSSQTFTATYYITDTLSHISKVYRQTFSLKPEANTVYPVTCHILDEEFRTIDLGLSCNWSNVNVGAREPSKAGRPLNTDDEANAALLEQTVVTQWLMPDEDQREEILEKCRWTFGIYNAQTGYFVEGAAVAKEYGEKLRIFLPCSTSSTKEQCLSQNFRPVEVLMVDLGLSSGVKWAARNLGATSVEDYGHYYAWGEVDTKDSYTQSNYKFGTQNLGNNYDISGTQNDAAVVNWGGIWRMPTYAEMKELSDSCSWSWGSINGVKGYIVAKKKGGTGNKIFLPAAGLMVNFSANSLNEAGSYATSLQGGDNNAYLWALTFKSNDRNLRNDGYDIVWDWNNRSNYRVWGHSIRPVTAPNAVTHDGLVLNITTDSTTWKLGDTTAHLFGSLSSTRPFTNELTVGFVVGDSARIVKGNERFDLHKTVNLGGSYDLSIDVYDNIGYWYRAYVDTGDTVFYGNARHYGYEMVDLGLSVKWANMNIGADAPEDHGYYFAWGETSTKSSYINTSGNPNNYKYGTRNLGEGLDIAGTENDAAHVNMGNAWRMPTKKEMEELSDSKNCDWKWTSQNNVNGYRVTSKKPGYTDRSIFLPAAGLMVNSSLEGFSSAGSYPTSLQGGDNSSYLWALTFKSNDRDLRNDGYDIVWDWNNKSNYRAWGHCVRAVATPNAVTEDGIAYNILTDSASWKLGDTQTRLYGTLSSTIPLTKEVTVGFVVGDSAQIVKGSERFLLEKNVSASGSYDLSVAVHDNIGYWYRAFVDTGDTVFYGKARHYGIEYVDLGLSVMWANMNVGASAPEECGTYFAWGEIETRDSYDNDNYLYGTNNLGNGLNISGTEHDAAHVNMGNAWRMPTKAEMDELCSNDNCKWVWTTRNNVNGFLVTSKKAGYTNKSIFLPATGLKINSTIYELNSAGSYMTSKQSDFESNYFYALTIKNNSKDVRGDGYDIVWDWNNKSNYRRWGHSVRAVFAPNAVKADSTVVMNILTDSAVWKLGDSEAFIYGTVSSTTPIAETTKVGFVVGDNAKITKGNAVVYEQPTTGYGSFSQQLTGISLNMGYWYRAYIETPDSVYYGLARHFGLEMVDLGLPSRTLWANINIGASVPEGYGDYYAWGETMTKTDYSYGTYTYYGQAIDTNGSIMATNYDVAYMNMGNNQWRLPTKTEYEELLSGSYCKWDWTTLNDVKGYKVTSKIAGYTDRSIFLPAAGLMYGASNPYAPAYGSYWSSTVGDNVYHTQTLNFRKDAYGIRGDGYSNAFDWNDISNTRYFGRSVRAVAVQKASRP